jgi:hypothetical protein
MFTETPEELQGHAESAWFKGQPLNVAHLSGSPSPSARARGRRRGRGTSRAPLSGLAARTEKRGTAGFSRRRGRSGRVWPSSVDCAQDARNEPESAERKPSGADEHTGRYRAFAPRLPYCGARGRASAVNARDPHAPALILHAPVGEPGHTIETQGATRAPRCCGSLGCP